MLTTERTIRICNSALLSIGQDSIDNFLDKNIRAESCRILFPPALEACLKSFVFEFSKKTTALTKLVGREGYQIPPKMITAIGLRKTCSCCDECESFYLNSDVGIVITDSALFINNPHNCSCGCPCDVLVYTSHDYKDLPLCPLFDKALISLLASDLCIRFSANITLKTRLYEEFQYWLIQAKKQQSINHKRVENDCGDIPFFRCRKGYLF